MFIRLRTYAAYPTVIPDSSRRSPSVEIATILPFTIRSDVTFPSDSRNDYISANFQTEILSIASTFARELIPPISLASARIPG